MPLLPVGPVGGFDVTKLPGAELGYVERSTDFTTTETVQANAVTVLTMPSITFDGLTTILIRAQFPAANAGAGVLLRIGFWEDSTHLYQMSFGGWDTQRNPMRATLRRTPTAGAKVYTTRSWLSTTGTGTLFAGTTTSPASVPGFMRITRV